MAEKGPWWRLASRKKSSTGTKEATAVQVQDSEPATKPAVDKASVATFEPIIDPQLDPQQGAKSSSEETNEESQSDPAFHEKSSRRNLKVSRSGRFKEKRRVRATIPENYQTKNPAATEDLR
ncbi:proline-rich protein 15-like protein-like [Scleropages formosus]|uniref:Proline-rich protein 15-like protein-like n=1 Tax=Scleropages formosus TaxID=113540 RepID=A0A0P7WZN2_SCLFO|nr:proline-rich protein 15-like protein-like [Scleropages formosus]